MRARPRGLVIVTLCATLGAAGCSSHATRGAAAGSGARSDSAPTAGPARAPAPGPAPVTVPPLDASRLGRVLGDWAHRNHAAATVVGVQIGANAPAFVASGASATTRFPIGGIGDAFVGAAAVRLAEQGRLDLDAKISRWLPGLPGAAGITVRELLRQQSGLAPLPAASADHTYDAQEITALAAPHALLFTPGTATRASNVNAILLGIIVTDVAGTSLAGTIHDAVLAPFGLTETRITTTLGTMTSTPAGLLAFAASYLRARARGRTDLAHSSFEIGPGGAGLGVEGLTADGFCALTAPGCPAAVPFSAVGATGSAPGGAATVVYDPRYDISVVALSSSDRADVSDLAQRVDLFTKLGAERYSEAVGFAAHAVPTTNAS